MTLVLSKGQRIDLMDFIDINKPFIVATTVSGLPIDPSMFGLDNQGKLSNDANMIFFNQPISPCGGIKQVMLPNVSSGQVMSFELDLTKTSPAIEKIVLVASVDMTNNGDFSALKDGEVAILSDHSIASNFDNSNRALTFHLEPSLFTREKAVMLIEIYRKGNTWRLSANAQGFTGGLDKVVEYFGATVSDTPATGQTGVISAALQSQPALLSATTPALPPNPIDLKKKISLEKAQKTGDDSIIDLTKKSLVSLEKRNLLSVKARVALVLDASGSMNWQYDNGDVQRIVNRVMPLAINFDDDGSFECWAFAENPQRLPDVNLSNVKNFIKVESGGYKRWPLGARINNEPSAIQMVMDYYQQFKDGIPVYVVFISDGGVGSSRQMQNILTKAAYLPIFWQFVGVGGRNYGILEKLDDMGGRVVDNCNFFEVDSINQISDEQLYDLLLEEFPMWLQAAKQKQIIV